MTQPGSNSDTADVLVEIKHLKKSFGDREVLKDVNLVLRRGENVGIMGKSGQGKSVTIKCIIGLLQQDGGSVNVMGKEIAQLSESELKETQMKMGFLFQGGAIYDSMTVRENLAFPLERVLRLKDEHEINGRVEEILEGVGLKDAIDKKPSELSGGMRKRIGLARALIVKPEIMLYDEPTTGLDPTTSKEISELIVEMTEKYKAASIIITHDLLCARITTSRIMVLRDGKFGAEGTFNELKDSKDEFVKSLFIF